MIATDEDVQIVEALLRIDVSDENKIIIKQYVSSAEKFLENAGCTVDYSDARIMDAVSMYVGKRYDDPEGAKDSAGEAMSLVSLIEQIRQSQAKASDAS